MLRWIAAQVSADPGDIESYAKRGPGDFSRDELGA